MGAYRVRHRTALPALRSQAKEGSDGPDQLCLFDSFETGSTAMPYRWKFDSNSSFCPQGFLSNGTTQSAMR